MKKCGDNLRNIYDFLTYLMLAIKSAGGIACALKYYFPGLSHTTFIKML